MANILPEGASAYDAAAKCLKDGGIVVLPTETVYGIACRADNREAVSRLFAAKARSADKTLPVCIVKPNMAQVLATCSATANAVMQEFWPGPLTVVLPLNRNRLDNRCCGEDDTIALRSPDVGWARDFQRRSFHFPLALTSANMSGAGDSLSVKEAFESLAEPADLYIDGGPRHGNAPSTIIAVNGSAATMIREGNLTKEHFKTFELTWTS